MVTGQHHLPFEEYGFTVAVLIQLGTDRHLACRRGLGIAVFVHHAELQGRGGPQDLLGARGVLHAGELYHDARLALLLDDGLRDAELVHAIAQGGQVLLQGQLALFFHILGLDSEPERRVGPVVLPGRGQVGGFLGDDRLRFGTVVGIAEGHEDTAVLLARHGLVAHLVVAQERAEIGHEALLEHALGGLHVHLHEEMDPATEIEAQEHGLGADGAQPRRGRGGEVQGHHVIVAERARDDLLGFELALGVVEAY